ncbi:MAG TPA: hypothetical protein VFO94_08605 [Gammaproteobacteria bacterium]|nr:hypothetical protein [Gammaproteobacteria bacterium]
MSAERRAQGTWSTGRARRNQARGDAARARALHLSAGERRRIVESAQRLLAAARASPDAVTRERVARLLHTVRRLAALLQRLSR